MNVPAMVAKYGLTPKGVIQVGSHHGEEHPIWMAMGIRALHFEPVQANYDKMRQLYPDADIWKIALGDQYGAAKMYTETVNGGQSCSLLEPVRHLDILPWIKFTGEEVVGVAPLDCYGFQNISPYNFMYVDAQGSELEIFKGAENTIRNCIDFIFTEVNQTEVFRHCAKVEELDRFLGDLGFARVETDWHGGEFGDALYVKR